MLVLYPSGKYEVSWSIWEHPDNSFSFVPVKLQDSSILDFLTSLFCLPPITLGPGTGIFLLNICVVSSVQCPTARVKGQLWFCHPWLPWLRGKARDLTSLMDPLSTFPCSASFYFLLDLSVQGLCNSRPQLLLYPQVYLQTENLPQLFAWRLFLMSTLISLTPMSSLSRPVHTCWLIDLWLWTP